MDFSWLPHPPLIVESDTKSQVVCTSLTRPKRPAVKDTLQTAEHSITVFLTDTRGCKSAKMQWPAFGSHWLIHQHLQHASETAARPVSSHIPSHIRPWVNTSTRGRGKGRENENLCVMFTGTSSKGPYPTAQEWHKASVSLIQSKEEVKI